MGSAVFGRPQPYPDYLQEVEAAFFSGDRVDPTAVAGSRMSGSVNRLWRSVQFRSFLVGEDAAAGQEAHAFRCLQRKA